MPTIDDDAIDLSASPGFKVDVKDLGDIYVGSDLQALLELPPAPPPGPFKSFDGGAIAMGAGVQSGTCNLVGDSEETPFRAVALLRIHMPDGPDLRGTAFFIKPGFLLTAGHNVFPDEVNPTSIDVMAAFNGQNVTQAFECRIFRPAPEYRLNAVAANDYGMIFLGRDLGVGNFGAVPATASMPSSLPVELISYPSADLRQHDCLGVVHHVAPDTIRYSIPTDGGSSGGPVFLSKGDPRVVAIHVKGPFGNLNEGTRLTARKIAQIKDWLANGPDAGL
jgi:V8-like Glu-specific endopeptidase